MQTPNSDHLQEKWAPLLDYEGLDPIKDPHRRAVTAALLENQEQAIREEREFLSEAAPTVNTNPLGNANAGFSAGNVSPVAGFDPVLISLIRRSMPNLVAYDLAGVQPMTGPTGLIFAMRSRFENMTGPEAHSTKQILHSQQLVLLELLVTLVTHTYQVQTEFPLVSVQLVVQVSHLTHLH